MGAVGIEMLKFEAKKEIFKKFRKNWGGGGGAAVLPPALLPMMS